MNSATILVADDEPQIRKVLRSTLSAQGYTVIEARDGQEALVKLREEKLDLILMDVNMPIMDGVEACRDIRRSSQVPIIMLTVQGSEKDKVRALDAGADDYVVKPFGIQELLARIRAALRRSSAEDSGNLASKELNFDFDNRVINVRGKPVHLTPKEFDLLRQFVLSGGRPISHRRLMQAVWGPDYGEETDSLRVAINQLRKKIEEDPARPKYILTEPWVGYRFVLSGETDAK